MSLMLGDGSGACYSRRKSKALGTYFHSVHRQDKGNQWYVANRTSDPEVPQLMITVEETIEVLERLQIKISRSNGMHSATVTSLTVIVSGRIRSLTQATVKQECVSAD